MTRYVAKYANGVPVTEAEADLIARAFGYMSASAMNEHRLECKARRERRAANAERARRASSEATS
ncbi:hypothetical protein [Nocardia cyriacigeorgica]|uniref:hypothetical protein n=1 Tax=Nocardia cyriacigeorgica TaxID=135487 RepID=UPI00245909B0|nr:hypothetical protein [Nocardia cyriacigeorgica]